MRVKHGIRQFDDNDMILYEAWPGSSTYILRRPSKQQQQQRAGGAFHSQSRGSSLNVDDLLQYVSRSVSDGIERGMTAAVNAIAGNPGNNSVLNTHCIGFISVC